MSQFTVDLVRELSGMIYSDTPDGACGCCLHILTDDGNTRDQDVEFCRREAIKYDHDFCYIVAIAFGQLAEAERREVLFLPPVDTSTRAR